MTAVLGIFVGGRSSRMGGHAKGLIAHPEGLTLLERLVEAGLELGLEVVLVGEAAPYVALVPAIERIPDDPQGKGPLGGLGALLQHAGDRPALSVACDMPFIDARSLERLLRYHPAAEAVATRRGEGAPWEPLFARWDPVRVEPSLRRALAEGQRSFQALLRELDVEELPLDAELGRALTDWDTPEDIR